MYLNHSLPVLIKHSLLFFFSFSDLISISSLKLLVTPETIKGLVPLCMKWFHGKSYLGIDTDQCRIDCYLGQHCAITRLIQSQCCSEFQLISTRGNVTPTPHVWDTLLAQIQINIHSHPVWNSWQVHNAIVEFEGRGYDIDSQSVIFWYIYIQITLFVVIFAQHWTLRVVKQCQHFHEHTKG